MTISTFSKLAQNDQLLYLAGQEGNLSDLKSLLSLGAQCTTFEVYDDQGLRPKALLKHPLQALLLNIDGECTKEQLACAACLLPHCSLHQAYDALVECINSNQVYLCQLLLDHYPFTPKEFEGALDHLIDTTSQERLGIVSLFVNHPFSTPIRLSNSLHRAVKLNKIRVVELLAPQFYETSHMNGSLHNAFLFGHIDIIHCLLKQKPIISSLNYEQMVKSSLNEWKRNFSSSKKELGIELLLAYQKPSAENLTHIKEMLDDFKDPDLIQFFQTLQDQAVLRLATHSPAADPSLDIQASSMISKPHTPRL